jgi:hypothetical protein
MIPYFIAAFAAWCWVVLVLNDSQQGQIAQMLTSPVLIPLGIALFIINNIVRYIAHKYEDLVSYLLNLDDVANPDKYF